MIKVVHKKSKLGVCKVLELPPINERPLKWDEATQNACDAFTEWLNNAMPGDRFCYYRGLYVSGKKVAGLVNRAYQKGLVTMYQSKEAKTYNYWVIKINPNKKA